MMTENYLLKLIIYQGRDWRISEDATVFIRASLGKNVAGTSPTSYTAPCPKFNAELCWEIDRKTLRGLKLNRLPIKVEFITGNQNCQKLLGYVILPLSLAAENIEVQAQWYKLLGGKIGSHKESPHILMALALTDADLEEKELSSDEEGWQGEADSEESSDNDGRPVHTNGHSKASEANGQPVNQNGHVFSDEICATDENDFDPEEVYDEASEVDPLDAEDKLDDDDGELSGREDGTDDDASFCSDDTDYHQDKSDLIDLQSDTAFGDKISPVKGDKRVKPAPSTDIKQDEQQEKSECSKLLDSRSHVRDQLRRLSKEHSLSQFGLSSHIKLGEYPAGLKRSLDISDGKATNAKRSLDLSDLANSCPKVRKIESSINNGDISSIDSIVGQKAHTSLLTPGPQRDRLNQSAIETSVTAGILKKPSDHSFKRNKNSSSVMDILLSTSGGEPTVPHCSTEEEPCRAELSEDNGFFRIFPTDSGEQKKYLYSIAIVYAKNLQEVVSNELWSKLKQVGLQFKYCLFGCSVFTEPFFSIDGHILLSEKGTATVSSSEEQLRRYFRHNSFLSVDLIAGNMVIANCTVDLEKMQTLDYRQQVCVEGSYRLSVGPAFAKHVQSEGATVGVCVELCQEKCFNKRDKIYVTKKSNTVSDCKYDNYTTSHHSRSNLSLKGTCSASSDSDSDEELIDRLMCRLKSGNSKLKSRRLTHAMKREKRDYLQEAALEIEKWKEEQKQIFLKKWASREETLQKHLASEWNTKVKIFESILEQRLNGCTQLQDKLSEALDQLSIQESKLRDRESKVSKIEKDLRLELNKAKSSHDDTMYKTALVDHKKIDLLENEVKKLKEQTRSAERNSKDQMKEIFSLRKTILEVDDTKIVKRENERLTEQLALTEEKKQYYKHQWTAAISDIHSMHSSRKHKSEVLWDGEPAAGDCTNLGLKIRHLIEERKALTESGLYPHSHSMVREIDKKIKSLINSSQNV